MFDDNTLIISYDKKRGEERGKWHRGESFENRGHCIDCKQCVVVCPTGIDIRNGLQMECIACGLCIDACDEVMEKVGLPKGLIRYDTLSHLLDPLPQKKFRFLQARTFYYSAILILVASLMLTSLIYKPQIETSIFQERNPLFITLSDGSIRNVYNLKIINKNHQSKKFSLAISKPIFAEIKISNHDEKNLTIPAETALDLKVFVTIPAQKINEISEDQLLIAMILEDLDTKKIEKISTIFIGK
jgi:cytochrome c oxidase accessory protein FixG